MLSEWSVNVYKFALKVVIKVAASEGLVILAIFVANLLVLKS